MDVSSTEVSPVGHSLPLVSFSPACCAEQVVATLEALAAEFTQEALNGGPRAQGLSVAAMVLRDRAAEVSNGNLDLLTTA